MIVFKEIQVAYKSKIIHNITTAFHFIYGSKKQIIWSILKHIQLLLVTIVLLFWLTFLFSPICIWILKFSLCLMSTKWDQICNTYALGGPQQLHSLLLGWATPSPLLYGQCKNLRCFCFAHKQKPRYRLLRSLVWAVIIERHRLPLFRLFLWLLLANYIKILEGLGGWNKSKM